jgi:glycosyltransferase involved in cell wall biosynthesis
MQVPASNLLLSESEREVYNRHMPKVSVIMPVYNAEKYLAETLVSVLSQTFADFEIVCVNDGSTDGSAGILEKYAHRDQRIKVINQANAGGSAARNKGMRHASGEYLMFIDADDLYAKDIVAKAYRRAVEEGADIVFYNFARFVGKPTGMAVKSRTTPGRDVRLFNKKEYGARFFNDFAIITWNKLVKKSVVTKNDLMFNVGLSHNHDVDFSIRLMLAANSYSYLDEIGYYYRSNDSGITATKRSDPTNVLKILIDLHALVASKHQLVKQSFDNYVVDMIAGTVEKYGNDVSKQKEVFDFAHEQVIPALGLKKTRRGYLYDSPSINVFSFVESGDYDGMMAYVNSPNRKLRRIARQAYDIAQGVLARLSW